MRNAGLEETQAGIKIAGRNINNLRYADDTSFMAKSEEELKNLLMKVKEESEKAGLKLNVQTAKMIQSHHFMANKWGNTLEKEMATHSSILAWKILWTEEPGGLPSLGSHRVGHD